MQRVNLMILALLVVLSLVTPAHAQSMPFPEWLESFKEKARAEGISSTVIEDELSAIAPDDTVVRLDQKQPENKISLNQYLKNVITPQKIATGKALMAEHRDVLNGVAKRYKVQPKFIVALWGIESNYGKNKGNFSVVQSLATLAYEGRRAEFFGKELIAALKIIESEHMAKGGLSGSWAGAMGDCQFMPSTFLKYAVDGNGDGHRDIWNTHADIFSSIANYLSSIGWDNRQGWGRTVMVPADFTTEEASISHGKTASQWRKRGLVYKKSHKKIAAGKETLYAIYPGTPDEGVYLVSQNFKALLEWNRSRYFATAVGKLADAIGD